MPPLKNIDRGLNGECLKALEEIGHGAQIAVVDASYDIPAGAAMVNYQGDSSADALRGILSLVPVDDDFFVAMAPDEHGEPCEALAANLGIMKEFDLEGYSVRRHGDKDSTGAFDQKGFYALANKAELVEVYGESASHTLFVRTRDRRPYACAVFIVGHSQEEPGQQPPTST